MKSWLLNVGLLLVYCSIGAQCARAGANIRVELPSTPSPPQQRVFCVTSSGNFGGKNYSVAPGEMLNKLCSDLFIHDDDSNWISIEQKIWRNTVYDYGKSKNPQNVRRHLSMKDWYVITSAPFGMFKLLTFLQQDGFDGLNIAVSPTTNPGILFYALNTFHDQYLAHFKLNRSLELSITVPSSWSSIITPEISDLVDIILAVPSVTMTSEPGTLIDDVAFVQRWKDSGVSSKKLIIGLPSVLYSGLDQSEENPNLLNKTCKANINSGSSIIQWVPEHASQDQLVWKNPNEKWNFWMLLGSSVENIVARHANNTAGFFLFDQEPFRHLNNDPKNPVCVRHQTLFARAVRHVLNNMPNREQDAPISSLPNLDDGWRIGSAIPSRLGKILAFLPSDGNESVSEFLKYFQIRQDESLLSSPIERIVLGYDDNGNVYNLHKPRCDELLSLSSIESILDDLVYRYLLGSVAKTANQPPPTVLIFPGSLINSTYTGLHPQVVPILITWFKVLRSQIIFNCPNQGKCTGNYVKYWAPKLLLGIAAANRPSTTVIPIEEVTTTVASIMLTSTTPTTLTSTAPITLTSTALTTLTSTTPTTLTSTTPPSNNKKTKATKGPRPSRGPIQPWELAKHIGPLTVQPFRPLYTKTRPQQTTPMSTDKPSSTNEPIGAGSLSRGKWDGPPPIEPTRRRFRITPLKPEADCSKASAEGPFLATTPGEISRGIKSSYNGARKTFGTNY